MRLDGQGHTTLRVRTRDSVAWGCAIVWRGGTRRVAGAFATGREKRFFFNFAEKEKNKKELPCQDISAYSP